MEEGPLVMDLGNLIAVVLGAIPSVLAAVLFARRTKKAEVRAKEAEARAKEIENDKGGISTAKAMIDLVLTANEEANKVQQDMIGELKAEIASNVECKSQQQEFVKNLKCENEKFKRTVSRLERAFGVIRFCDHRDDCPVYSELQELRPIDRDENGDTSSKG